MEYANRRLEIYKMKQAIPKNNIVFLSGAKECGMTSFLEILQDHLKAYSFIQVNLNNTTLLRSELGKAIYKIYPDSLQAHVDKQLGKRSVSQLLGGSLSGIPIVGETLSAVLDYTTSKRVLPLYVGDYFSQIDEAILSFLPTLPLPIVIMVDRADSIDETSFSYISTIIETSNNIKFIFASREQSVSILKLRNYIDGFVNTQYTEIPFHGLNEKLVLEIGKTFNLSLHREDANLILNKCNHSIHSVFFRIKNGRYPDEIRLDDFEKRIITYLSFWSFGLSVDELALLNEKHYIAYDEAYEMVDEMLYQFEANGIVTSQQVYKDQSLFFIQSEDNPIVKEALADYITNLACARDIYSYFIGNISQKGTVDELIVLYAILNKYSFEDATHLAQVIVEKSLISGDTPPESTLDKLPSSDYGFFLKTIQLTRNGDYQKALNVLGQLSSQGIGHNQHKLKAILLNRTRQHEDAEHKLSICIRNEQSNKCRNVLLAYKLVNYIHMEKLDEARSLFESEYTSIKSTENAGYILRNATSLYSSKQLELLDEAIENFLDYDDNFGFGSTLCNKATYLIKNKSEEKGEIMQLLNQAKAALGGRGSELLYPLYNSLGLAYMTFKSYDKALWHFQQAKSCTKDSMPIILCAINEAITLIFMERAKEAVAVLAPFFELASFHPVDRVKQLYFPHYALSLFSAGEPVSKDIIQTISEYPDRYKPHKTKYYIQFYSELINKKQNIFKIESLEKLASPCSIVYWYINPLKVLSGDAISNPLTP